MTAIREKLSSLVPHRGKRDSHPGLLLQRYLHESATGDDGDPEQKRQILDAAINASANPEVRELYKIAYRRWKQEIDHKELTTSTVLQTPEKSRLIVGLGTENVLETGIRLHHTYGMPILPGSALKGLAAHYCDQVWGEQESKFKNDGEYHQLLFGTTDESGCIIFHDGWLTPDSPSPLKLDVMTPHHPKWLDGSEPPTDFDSPIPVPFLSVAGRFHVAVSWYGPASDKAVSWRDMAMTCLRDALFNWGIGGKTTSGYGVFDEEKWKAEEAKRQEEAEKKRVVAEKEAALAAMSPIERSIKEFLEGHPDKQAKESIKLLKELEKPAGRFQDAEDRKVVAARIKAAMQRDKEWKDKEPFGNRKNFIEQILGE